MVDLVAKKNAPYGGKRKAGDTFSMPSRDARVLVAMGHAVYAPKPEVKESRRQYKRRDMVAEQNAMPTVETHQPTPQPQIEQPPAAETVSVTVKDPVVESPAAESEPAETPAVHQPRYTPRHTG